VRACHDLEASVRIPRLRSFTIGLLRIGAPVIGGLVVGPLAGVAPAVAQIYEGGISGYCKYIAPPGDDQPLHLTASIPAGRTVHLDVVTSAGVSLESVDDVQQNAYAVVGGGAEGSFAASLLVGDVALSLPSGDSITVHLTATGGGGTSCVSSFLASGVMPAVDQSAFTTGAGRGASLPIGARTAARELVHTVLFGSPTEAKDPIATRIAPLADAGNNVCVGTSSGRLCSFESYALLDGADPFTATIDLDAGLSWGFAAATFEAPEPEALCAGGGALAALAILARRRRVAA
jgi:hypothetical protein